MGYRCWCVTGVIQEQQQDPDRASLNVVFISVVQGLICALLRVQRNYLKLFSHGVPWKVRARFGALLLFPSDSRCLLPPLA